MHSLEVENLLLRKGISPLWGRGGDDFKENIFLPNDHVTCNYGCFYDNFHHPEGHGTYQMQEYRWYCIFFWMGMKNLQVLWWKDKLFSSFDCKIIFAFSKMFQKWTYQSVACLFWSGWHRQVKWIIWNYSQLLASYGAISSQIEQLYVKAHFFKIVWMV